MKKIIFTLLAAVMTLSASAQGIEIQNSSNQVVASYGSGYKAVLKKTVTAKDPTKFSVSATKQVEFSKGNLYWDGTNKAWKFETNQTDYDHGTTSGDNTTYTSNHISHFYWSKTASVMYAASYNDDSAATTDAFFFCEANKNNEDNQVDGASGYYALTSAEWTYLINERNNASSLYKYGVTVTNGSTNYTNCLIIAPDGYTGTLLPLYNLADINSAGLVCLPAAGYRDGSSLNYGGEYGYYWSATPNEYYKDFAYELYFISTYVYPAYSDYRGNGSSVRLVK